MTLLRGLLAPHLIRIFPFSVIQNDRRRLQHAHHQHYA